MLKTIIGMLFALLLSSLTSLAQQGDFVEFQRILDEKCSKCHTRVRIEQAMQRGDDLDQILKKMIRFGAQLSEKEQQVLGVFWRENPETGQPAQISRPSATTDPLGEYRSILESRCTRCHRLERVEEAMRAGRSIDDLIEMMRQRGAIVTESEWIVP